MDTKIRSNQQKINQQFKKCLRSSTFKKELTKFLLQEWSRPEYARKLKKRSFFVTAGTKCHRLKANEYVTEINTAHVTDLICTH